MKHLLALVLAIAATAASDSRLAIEPDALMSHVKYLASDELQGRGNGTKGLDKAGDYIAAQFKAAGLQPGGSKGSWFQSFELMTGLTVGEANRLTV